MTETATAAATATATEATEARVCVRTELFSRFKRTKKEAPPAGEVIRRFSVQIRNCVRCVCACVSVRCGECIESRTCTCELTVSLSRCRCRCRCRRR